MSADLKRVRAKQDEGYLSPVSKKRALAGGAGPSGVGSGQAEEEEGGMEDWMKVVEVKRKEAIYRQMLEYRRSYETENRKVRELEEQRKRLEASCHALEVCWTQVVAAMRNQLGQEEQLAEPDAMEPILELQIAQPELEKALSSRLPATRQLLKRITDPSGSRPSNEHLQQRCLNLQAESSTLRSANQTLRNQLSSAAESSDKYRSDLARAEKRYDKQRMEHDRAEQEWRSASAGNKVKEESATPGLKPQTNGPGSGHATPNGKTEEDVKPDVNNAIVSLQDNTELEQLADTRLKELLDLRKQHTSLQLENDKLRQLTLHPSEDSLRASPFFQLYLHQISSHYSRAEALQKQFESAESRLDKVHLGNQAFRDMVQSEAKAESDALRTQVQRLNTDSARLRGQRDEAVAEAAERKLREESRLSIAEEMEGLAKKREERIGVLMSEVKRLKGRLGADSGSKGYLDFLRKEGIDADYIKSLEARVADAEASAAAGGSSDVGAAKVELEKAQRKLAQYERILGPNSEASDVSTLARQLETNEKARFTLQLQLEQAESSTNALYTEVETLAKLADPLQSQLSTKVSELKDVDSRMSRLTTEKAKADNKYFQAMRSKEAVEAECKAAQRSVDKQLKLLEKAQEVERGLLAQIAAHEKSFIAIKNEASSLQTQLATTSAERSHFEIRYKQAQAALTDAQTIMQQRVGEAANEKESRIRLQEDLNKTSSALKKVKEKQEHLLANSRAGDVSASEVQLRDERDKLLKLLRCSCCAQNFKQQVIVKCMHTFCKDCLEQRIASRQRKCPACGLSFAKEDVQTIYWQ